MLWDDTLCEEDCNDEAKQDDDDDDDDEDERVQQVFIVLQSLLSKIIISILFSDCLLRIRIYK